MDHFMMEESETLWKEFQEKELQRAKKVFDKILSEYIEKNQTIEAFKKIWYSQLTDKKGESHLYNLVMSCSQTRKQYTGKTFENTIYQLHKINQIKTLNQTYVDNIGEIYKKKPKNKSVHKHDCLISNNKDITNISECYVISIKTTLRERFRQDLDSVDRCKKVIFITRDAPTKGQIDSVSGYNCILVYPKANLTENTWSYEEYVSRMKAFQQSLCNNIC